MKNKILLFILLIVIVVLAFGYSKKLTGKSNQALVATTTSQKVLTDKQILAMADNKYADGQLPLGDNKYVTKDPKVGYVYLCNARADQQGGGAGKDGPWITGKVWNYLQKLQVAGAVTWPNAKFTNTSKDMTRTLSGNGLPINHTTGTYPVASNDPAYTYDRNPNSISAQTMLQELPLNPVYSETPNCMGGEVGIMLTGVPLFNGFDATLRDAAAHEIQDSCDGHPQNRGQYHYHSLSSCIKDVGYKTVIGYALDGFPITGPKVADKKYLTTEDLDVCHGITSEIIVEGKKKTTYHYVMTRDFPYSASCFRGKPASLQVGGGQGGQQQQGGQRMPPPPGGPGMQTGPLVW